MIKQLKPLCAVLQHKILILTWLFGIVSNYSHMHDKLVLGVQLPMSWSLGFNHSLGFSLFWESPNTLQGGRSCVKARRAFAKKFGLGRKFYALTYAILRFVAIYPLLGNLWAKKCCQLLPPWPEPPTICHWMLCYRWLCWSSWSWGWQQSCLWESF